MATANKRETNLVSIIIINQTIDIETYIDIIHMHAYTRLFINIEVSQISRSPMYVHPFCKTSTAGFT